MVVAVQKLAQLGLARSVIDVDETKMASRRALNSDKGSEGG